MLVTSVHIYQILCCFPYAVNFVIVVSADIMYEQKGITQLIDVPS